MDIDVIQYLQQEINIQNAPHYAMISNRNLTESQMTEISHSLHNMIGVYGEELALKKVLDLYRVNPLLAVKTMERCVLNRYAKEVAYGMKLLFDATTRGEKQEKYFGLRQPVILNKSVDYMILLIEASFQNSVCDLLDAKEIFLRYVKDEDYRAHQTGEQTKYLVENNIRHIFKHIPENRQIELINWFWAMHCYAVKNYRKKDTYASRRVAFMMKEMTDSCLWKHLENRDKTELSDEERRRVGKEAYEIARFLDLTIDEGNHLEYVERVLGKDDLDEKLTVLLGQEAPARYKRAVAEKKKRDYYAARNEARRKERERKREQVKEVTGAGL